ncbi:MAG TPA: Crp/Fnr family transcriptional regulator [Bacteroides mediterraneensis]|uniref:Crp/Fnr family transcriptional regulator n=1 Tax=Bacteroides mediterraneensis TaxID=1841856 RepID=UPI0026061FBF|nr:Crp/Fnr family transcriptional regulator [Bacteroides mediterraneensis]HJH64408.1 Crp/Fnr family transcriptional regulator [Bacteroides mediterraneensis]
MHTEVLTRMSLFEGCEAEALHQLLREAPNSLRTYKEGEYIARQGDACRSLFILMKGNVKTQMENAEGKQLTIDWIKAPDILAPAFIYASENRFPVNVEATELCEVLVMDRTRFEAFMHAQPAVMRNFIAIISDRSLFLSRKLNEFALQSLKSRLLNYLQMHGGIHNQQEVAFILGVARPSLARALSELIAEGKITMTGKQVVLNTPE